MEEVTLPATRRPKSRKSLAEIPDQENMTAELGALTGKRAMSTDKPAKKSRSKSIGPGGLDALKDTTGNRRKVDNHLCVEVERKRLTRSNYSRWLQFLFQHQDQSSNLQCHLYERSPHTSRADG